MPQSDSPRTDPAVEHALLVGMVAAQFMDDLGRLKRSIGNYVRPEDFPDPAEAKRVFWDIMGEAFALVRKSDLAKAKPRQPKGGSQG